jgi:hypothetical protein
MSTSAMVLFCCNLSRITRERTCLTKFVMEALSGVENSCDLALRAENGVGAEVTRPPRARTRNIGTRGWIREKLEETMMMESILTMIGKGIFYQRLFGVLL